MLKMRINNIGLSVPSGTLNLFLLTKNQNVMITDKETKENGNLPIFSVSHFYSVGDIVPYKNTRGNIKQAKITDFKQIDRNGKWWFYGIDTKTNANVYYPEHLSRKLANCGYVRVCKTKRIADNQYVVRYFNDKPNK